MLCLWFSHGFVLGGNVNDLLMVCLWFGGRVFMIGTSRDQKNFVQETLG